MRLHRFHRPSVAFLLGLIALLLGACSSPTQFDPPGSNSGSPQYSRGSFLLDDPSAHAANVGQAVPVYDTFTTITTNFTVTDATTMMTPANQNTTTDRIPDGSMFLILHVRLQNMSSASATSCSALNACTYFSPLNNFRLFDDQQRSWPTTTGAAETCSTDPQTMCDTRRWLDEATNGMLPGSTFEARLAFTVPSDTHTYSLFFAPYRFVDNPYVGIYNSTTTGTMTTTPVATGTVAPTKGTPMPTAPAGGHTTLVKVTISV